MKIHLLSGQILTADRISFIARPNAGGVIAVLQDDGINFSEIPLSRIDYIQDAQTEDNLKSGH